MCLSPVRVSAYAMLALAALAYSTNFIVAKLIQDGVPPFTLTAVRQVVSFLSLLPFFALSPRGGAPTARMLPNYLFLGMLGIAIPHALVYVALYRTQAINVALINAALPLLILLVGYLAYRTKPSRAQVIGIAISSIGTMTILLHGTPFALADLAFNLGDLMAFAAFVSVAVYTVLLAKRGTIDQAVPLLAGLTAASAVLLAPVAIVEYVFIARWTPTLNAVIGIVYVGLVPSTVGMLCWNLAVVRLGAATAGQAVHLIPAFTAVLAVPVLGEGLHAYHVVGFLLVALGILVLNRGIRHRAGVSTGGADE